MSNVQVLASLVNMLNLNVTVTDDIDFIKESGGGALNSDGSVTIHARL
jgi:hypothetical protein